jgi:hypothetical protein
MKVKNIVAESLIFGAEASLKTQGKGTETKAGEYFSSAFSPREYK